MQIRPLIFAMADANVFKADILKAAKQSCQWKAQNEREREINAGAAESERRC